MTLKQSSFGFGNSQKIENTTYVVDPEYLKHLLKFENSPSDLNQVVLALFGAMDVGTDQQDPRALPPEIAEKIKFNNVTVFKLIIEENFSENGFFLDNAFNALDSDTPGRKQAFMKFIRNQYLLILGKYQKEHQCSSPVETAQKFADEVITDITQELLLRIAGNAKALGHISKENIELIVLTIVCHAFVDCKVLENPNHK